jgi:hypothetical protein
MNRMSPFEHSTDGGRRHRTSASHQKGIHDVRRLPSGDFDGLWESIILLN